MRKNKFLYLLSPIFATPFLTFACKCDNKKVKEDLQQIANKMDVEISNDYKNL